MSQVNANSIYDASGGQSAKLYGVSMRNGGTAYVNRIINGSMTIDQRNAGASVTPTNGQYSVDRWACLLSQASKYSIRQNAGSVTPPSGFTNYLGVTSLSAYSVGSGDYFSITQVIEGFNVADLGWGAAGAQSVTLSFWVRSSLPGTFGGALTNYTGTRSYPFTYTISAANTWEQKTITIAGDTSGTWNKTNSGGLQLWFGLGVGSTSSGTAGAWTGANYQSATGAVSVVGTNGATFYITGVQLEAGSVASPFERRDYGRELMMAQRYFQLLQNSYATTITSTAIGRCTWPLRVTMRASMTLSAVGTPTWYYGSGTATYSSIATNYSIPEMAQADLAVTGSTGTTGLLCSSSSGGSGYFTASAEL
jgi:hypothetical protein